MPVGTTIPTWEAYASAFRERYGAEPVRNATVNGQLAALIKRIGAEEAPLVAAFYVSHNKAFYAQRLHPVKLLLGDCEALRTEWATGRQVTATEARSGERTQANADGWGSLLKEKQS